MERVKEITKVVTKIRKEIQRGNTDISFGTGLLMTEEEFEIFSNAVSMLEDMFGCELRVIDEKIESGIRVLGIKVIR